MKKQFAEYYELPEERITKMWSNSLIVFDTNVLLNLYRYPEDARNEFIKVIKFYKERLWIPYQVGWEFHQRRENIIRKHAAAYRLLGDSIAEQLVKVIDSLSSNGDFARHPYINIKDIRKKVEKCAASIAKSLEKQGTEHPDFTQNDEILNAITDLFDGCVGNDFSDEDLESLYKSGEERYKNQVPPGYCDEKKKKDKSKRTLYGDLIVWMQLIQRIKDEPRDVIFVTDDHKPDWWDKIEGRHTPRKELIKEFMDSTGQNILIYDSSRFLEYAKKNKDLKVSQKTINEVAKTRDIDFSITDFLNVFSRINSRYGGMKQDRKYTLDFVLDSPLNEQNDYYHIGDVHSQYGLPNWGQHYPIDPASVLSTEYPQEPLFSGWGNLRDRASWVDPQILRTYAPKVEDKKE